MSKFDMKEHLMRERNRFSLGRFIREVFRAWKEQQDMYNYLRENQRYLDCNLFFPSKPLAKRYGVGNSSNARVWAVIEEYIELQKDKELCRTRVKPEVLDILKSQTMKPSYEKDGHKVYVFEGLNQKMEQAAKGNVGHVYQVTHKDVYGQEEWPGFDWNKAMK